MEDSQPRGGQAATWWTDSHTVGRQPRGGQTAAWWTDSRVVDRQSRGGRTATWRTGRLQRKSKKMQRVKEEHGQVQASIRKDEGNSYTNPCLSSERQGDQVSGKKGDIISLKE